MNNETPEIVVKNLLGLPVKIVGRGVKADEVIVERVNDGARRVRKISELHCAGGEAAIRAELERVCAADKAL